MTSRAWEKIALVAALMAAGSSAQSQPVGMSGVQGGGAEPAQQRHVEPSRPAPVSGRISNDPVRAVVRQPTAPVVPAPAAVALPVSTAKRVAPPTNPNEPLLAATANTPSADHHAEVVKAKHKKLTEKPRKVAGKHKPRSAHKKVKKTPHKDRTVGHKKQAQANTSQAVKKSRSKHPSKAIGDSKASLAAHHKHAAKPAKAAKRAHAPA